MLHQPIQTVGSRVYIIGLRWDGALNGCLKWPERDLIKKHSNVLDIYIHILIQDMSGKWPGLSSWIMSSV